ncbi:MAG: hypothetical protein AAF747_02235 [Planctomycetota bacterium]
MASQLPRKTGLGGVIHSYQGYDPTKFPSPTAPPPDMASAAMEYMMQFGSTRELTEEELANAIRLDPSQIAGLGPSLDALFQMLEERKRKILETYEVDSAVQAARDAYTDKVQASDPPAELADTFGKLAKSEQLYQLEQLWYAAEKAAPDFAAGLLRVVESLGDKYQIDELASERDFTGREAMDIPKALEIKEELDAIDKLLEQLREAMKTAQIAIVDMDELRRFVDDADAVRLNELQQRVRDYLRYQAEQQGLDVDGDGNVSLSPKAYRIFQGHLLDEIFSELEAARSGRHTGPISGDGATELAKTRPYEFGDSAANMDVAQSFVNAMLRQNREGMPWQVGDRIRLDPRDIEVHETRNNPKCASCVLMDMSGSMRYGGQYVNCKRMAMGLDGLIRREYPGDFLRFIEIFSIARPVPPGQVASLMPKPVTIYDPVVRLRADMSDPEITDSMIPPHFTNIQHGLRLSRQFLGAQDTPNRQVMLITDGLPTAHFEDESLYLLYPPDPLTEEATMREASLCAREGITINIFLIPSWNQSEEDVRFAHAVAEQTGGRVFFTAGKDLDRFVLWDYVSHRRRVIG